MRFTKEMLAEDEKRWHARDVVTELGYCGNYMRDRKDMKNIDIRFYAYIMRKAHDMLKAQEPVEPTIGGDADGPCKNWWYQCGKCKEAIDYHDKYCRNCGKAVKWDADQSGE